jgi:hypothetical protein
MKCVTTVVANNKRLLDYVANGGTLIVQYNKQEFARGNLAPFPIKLDGNQRVTDETAPVTVQATRATPSFNFPNKISAAGLEWMGAGARSYFFLNEWSSDYTPLLSAAR